VGTHAVETALVAAVDPVVTEVADVFARWRTAVGERGLESLQPPPGKCGGHGA
jgi:hypothetical protein